VYELLRKSFMASPVIDRNGYPYFVNPISDGVPRVDPALLNEVVEGLIDLGDFDCDVILAPEAMGIPLAVPISLRLGIPYSIVRKRGYGLPGEIIIDRSTGYSSGSLYINGPGRGDRAVIVEDTLSTGGTVRALALALASHGIRLVEVLAVFDKTGDLADAVPGVRVKAMLRVGVRDGKPFLDC
jgi:adenine phosphoribosyltransferase